MYALRWAFALVISSGIQLLLAGMAFLTVASLQLAETFRNTTLQQPIPEHVLSRVVAYAREIVGDHRPRDPRKGGRRGSRTLKPVRATRFRDGVPRRWQSFRGVFGPLARCRWRESGPGRRRTCNPPLKRRELCQLSYGARASGIAWAPEPRSRRGSRLLDEVSEQVDGSLVASQMVDGDRRVEELHSSSRRARLKPRPGRNGRPLLPRPPEWDVEAAGGPRRSGFLSLPMSRSAPKPNDVVQATRLPFDPGSSSAGCAVRSDRRPTWRGFGARVSRTSPKLAGESRCQTPMLISSSVRRSLSPSGGASIRSRSSSSWASPRGRHAPAAS